MDMKEWRLFYNQIFVGIFGGLYLIGGALYLLRRKKDPLHRRGISPLLHLLVPLLDLLLRVFQASLPCGLEVLRYNFLIPLWIYPYFLKGFFLWAQDASQKRMMVTKAASPSSPSSPSPSFTSKVLNFFRERKNNYLLFETGMMLGVTLLLLIIVLPCFFSLPRREGNQCVFQGADILVALEGVIAVILIGFFIYLLWGVQDGYLFKVELSATLGSGFPMLILWILATFQKWEGPPSSALWIDLAMIGTLCASILLPVLSSFYYEKKMNRKKKLRNSVSMNSGRQQEITVILNDPILLAEFEKFCSQRWSVENLYFVLEINKFETCPPEQKKKRAIEIIELFVEEGSEFQVNLEMETREKLQEWKEKEKEKGKEEEKEGVEEMLFEGAKTHIESLLKYSLLSLWRGSPSYLNAYKLAQFDP